jgi:hypothetical protein
MVLFSILSTPTQGYYYFHLLFQQWILLFPLDKLVFSTLVKFLFWPLRFIFSSYISIALFFVTPLLQTLFFKIYSHLFHAKHHIYNPQTLIIVKGKNNK